MRRYLFLAIGFVVAGCVNTPPPGQAGINAVPADTAAVVISANVMQVPNAWVALGNRVYFCKDTSNGTGVPPRIACYPVTLP
jgi:hypothetical protein